MKIASSGTLEALRGLIADFYATKPARITIAWVGTHWQVWVGEKEMTPIVTHKRGRFVFGTLGVK